MVTVCTDLVPAGYRFVQGQDNYGGDIGYGTGRLGFAVAAASCDATPDCVGVNSEGWRKYTLANLRPQIYYASNPCDGMLVRGVIL